MEARLVREELAKCRKGEGVNSYQNCKYLADLYLELLKDANVSLHLRNMLCFFAYSVSVHSVLTLFAGQGIQASGCAPS
jgi:hypothetical protein